MEFRSQASQHDMLSFRIAQFRLGGFFKLQERRLKSILHMYSIYLTSDCACLKFSCSGHRQQELIAS